LAMGNLPSGISIFENGLYHNDKDRFCFVKLEEKSNISI
jgi:hypothetical protein